jgi:glutaminyl-tRNA synthetase
VRGTIHWVNANDCAQAEVRLYGNLFSDADPDAPDKDFIQCLNPLSLEILAGCKVERMLAETSYTGCYQFLRLGYFCRDSRDSSPGHLVFNRAVALKDSFSKFVEKAAGEPRETA